MTFILTTTPHAFAGETLDPDFADPHLEIPLLTSVPKLADFPQSKVWQDCALIPNLADPHFPLYASNEPTSVRLGWDKTALYVGFDCAKHHYCPIEGREGKVEVYKDDCVEIHLAPFGKEKTTYQFIINSVGMKWATRYKENSPDNHWQPAWQVYHRRCLGGWQTVVVIKFTSLCKIPHIGETWRGNLCRAGSRPLLRLRHARDFWQWTSTAYIAKYYPQMGDKIVQKMAGNHIPSHWGHLQFVNTSTSSSDKADKVTAKRTAWLKKVTLPDDHLLRPQYTFKPVNQKKVLEVFVRAHQVSEKKYKGNGDWSCLPRFTARRVAGYIGAWGVTKDPVYKQRAIEGLDYLVRIQTTEGYFTVGLPQMRKDRHHWSPLQNNTGLACRALLLGYKAFGDPRYLEAGRRAVEWAVGCPLTSNINYNMFSVWGMTEYIRQTGDQEVLESAIRKVRYGCLPRLRPWGAWPGHNSTLGYHGIILRALYDLLAVLPQDHPFREKLSAGIMRATNRLIAYQRPSGRIPNNNILVPNPTEKGKDAVSNTTALQCLVLARAYLNMPREPLDGLLSWILQQKSEPYGATHPDVMMALGFALEYSSVLWQK